MSKFDKIPHSTEVTPSSNNLSENEREDITRLTEAARAGQELNAEEWDKIKRLAEENVRRIEANPDSTPHEKAQAAWYRSTHIMLDKFMDLEESVRKLAGRFE
jgi:hypothetical protein